MDQAAPACVMWSSTLLVTLNHSSIRCGEYFVNSVAEGFLLGEGETTG